MTRLCENMTAMTTTDYGEKAVWAPMRPRIGLVRVLVTWIVSTVALLVAAWIVPGADVESLGRASSRRR